MKEYLAMSESHPTLLNFPRKPSFLPSLNGVAIQVKNRAKSDPKKGITNYQLSLYNGPERRCRDGSFLEVLEAAAKHVHNTWGVPASWLMAQAILNTCGTHATKAERRGRLPEIPLDYKYCVPCGAAISPLCGCGDASSPCEYQKPIKDLSWQAWRVVIDPHYKAALKFKTGLEFILELHRCGYNRDPGWIAAMSHLIRRFELEKFDM
jgi:hypothetical protein